MKFIRSRVDATKYSGNQTISEFEVSITKTGQNFSQPCTQGRLRSEPEALDVYDSGYFRCTAGLIDYVFNVNTGRFLQSYLAGYVDGEDNNDNTPYVAAGTCTKLD